MIKILQLIKFELAINISLENIKCIKFMNEMI
jgi:hypothetical protein